ncbi:MAG: DUF421 domain-containing protein [Oscillospiraceae bacterium]|jgi:uncharacterized membrane protein YcaP (DUF421 family)|nr:DUF421 domain-containing protein [Oscillospiraceae bacterium]
MVVLKIIWLSFFSLGVLFVIAKLIGNKQISQLSVFDYIIGITMGNIAAEMATSITDSWVEPLVAMLVYGFTAFGISIISIKSIKARKFLWGRPLIMYQNGKLFEKNLFKAKLDITEFQMMCRSNGYHNLADVGTALLEPNGQLSFIPVAARRPATPEDLNLFPKQEEIVVNIILDGKILETNLKYLSKNKFWLRERLNEQGYADEKNVSLATCDGGGDVSVYMKMPKSETKDLFE